MIPEGATLTVTGTLAVNGDVDLKGKLLIASLDSINTKKAFTIAAGGELYVKPEGTEAAIIGKSGLTGSAGTELSAGKVTVDVGAKTVTIGDGTTATTAKVLGWPDDWAAVIENKATVTLTSLESVANVGRDITVKAGGVLQAGENNIFGTGDVTVGTSLSAGLVKLNVKSATVTIGDGATTTAAKVVGWPDDWAAVIENNAAVTLASLTSVANVEKDITVKAGGVLNVVDEESSGTKNIFGTGSVTEGTSLSAGLVKLNVKSATVTIGDGATTTTAEVAGWPDSWKAVIEKNATVTLASLEAVANVTADITVKAGADLGIKNGNAIFFSTNDASATEGTYLATGSVTLSGNKATFSADATGTIYGWPTGWNAEQESAVNMAVRSGLSLEVSVANSGN